ncbi:MAG TPA: flagellar basal body L-ring protein FlgH [Deltaproteobacteria bacterium]|nr:flagellar basal body L-ring protein FlgH [Deltaproteobacteria bacterium]
MRMLIVMLAAALLGAAGGCAHSSMDASMEREFAEDELYPPAEESVEGVKSPGSLWSENAKFYDMYSDRRARRVGDVVTVQIVESSSADKEAKTEASRSSSTDNSVSSFLGLPLDHSSVFGYTVKPEVSTSSTSEFEGDGKTSRKGTLTAVVAARITRVLPSGNYLLKGKKQIRVNDEAQYIVVSGIVRPDDIMWNNAVVSTKIADLRVDYYGKGILGDQQNKGFLARVIDKVWPF